MSDTLTIVGGSARAAAQSAARSGFFVRAADLFADEDLRRIANCTQVGNYPRGLAEVLRGPQPGAWIYTGALENHPRLIAEWSQVRPLRGNPPRVLRRVRNPLRVAAALANAGLTVPGVTLRRAEVPCDGSWLSKPLHSAGGAQIEPWRGAGASTGTVKKRRYYQQRIGGVPMAALYVAARGRATLLGITEQLVAADWTGAGAFRYCGSVVAGQVAENVWTRFAEIGEVLAREFDLVGLFGADAVVNDDGVWPVEVNPRYTASAEVLERAFGIPMIEVHCRACAAGELPVAPPRRSGLIAGKAIAFATRPYCFPDDARLSAELRTLVKGWPALADFPAAGTAIETGWPIATVLAEGTDREAVLETLKRRCGLLVAACAGAI